ncbi:MAG: AAA family ATPase [Pirellulaceae bacterium]|nr:AAA family ATPase [Pirellulaceae bacterium]
MVQQTSGRINGKPTGAWIDATKLDTGEHCVDVAFSGKTHRATLHLGNPDARAGYVASFARKLGIEPAALAWLESELARKAMNGKHTTPPDKEAGDWRGDSWEPDASEIPDGAFDFDPKAFGTIPAATSEIAKSDSRTARDDKAKPKKSALQTRNYGDIQMESVSWLWQDRIALGKLSLVAGVPGVGKTFLLCDIAARISRGAKFPDGANCPQAQVLIMTAEDGPEDTIKPRLVRHNADCSRIHHVDCVATGKRQDHFTLTMYLDVLNDWLQAHRDAKLVILDPITAFLGDKIDSHKNAEVRSALGPLCKLAETLDVAVVGITHLSKGQAKAINRVIGSIAFVGAARACWLVDWCPDQEGRRLMLPIKNNLGVAQGLAYRIVNGALEWEAGAVTMTADDLGDGGHTTPRDEAEDWLREALQEGRLQSSKLSTEAKRVGISERTLQRAKKALGIISQRDGQVWYWMLPDADEAPESTVYDFGEYSA